MHHVDYKSTRSGQKSWEYGCLNDCRIANWLCKKVNVLCLCNNVDVNYGARHLVTANLWQTFEVVMDTFFRQNCLVKMLFDKRIIFARQIFDQVKSEGDQNF